MKIELKRITKKYKGIIALDNINLKLEHGIWGVLGANGAGKSTLLEIIVGNLRSSKGTVFYNNKAIENFEKSYRNMIGYLPQGFNSGQNFSVYDYLEYVAALKDIPLNTTKKVIKNLIDQFELENYLNKSVNKLSGGTKQRVGIAQALINNPQILVLDEPTSGLDPKERIRLRSVISNLGKSKIILLSTHIVTDIESISDMNIILSHGKIIDICSLKDFSEGKKEKLENYYLDVLKKESLRVLK